MRQVNLNGIDLNLLPPLEALLRLRNVSEAASATGLSQPAMSRTLARLRDVLDDPLLVRVGRQYALTPKASLLQPELHQALQRVSGLFDFSAFDPLQEKRLVRFVGADTHTIQFFPPLVKKMSAEAPGIELSVEPYSPGLFQRMNDGSLDFAFALANTPLPRGLASQPMGQDRLALVMRRGNPAAGSRCTLKQFAKLGHVGVRIFGDGVSEIDRQLAAAGLKREMKLMTPHFMAALATVSQTDLVTTISRAFAEKFAASLDLVVMEPPLTDIELKQTVVYPQLRKDDRFLVWMVAAMQEVARKVYPS
ncbi:LysR family transcriptional regulator [Aestuariivirga litoralis]|uniref:LysR family transcriptional regulator n=1 Tax=Aestuariivirga litoralis TaxID=2650924 RepID=UPI0018C560F8|nr:LysR family transcriptional regulator [Aestuariivirga litoralis]MBG1232862.1 LysR family transcriptional regulator [Aestuariivirga litoralis]